jgi:hypothetical protein
MVENVEYVLTFWMIDNFVPAVRGFADK